jgi:predicted carbohydrate-binding protein with CBM5 and CBM33 domain
MRAIQQPTPSFDQIVKGNVSIKKLRKYKYKITFSKIGKFLMYQVWDKDNTGQQNDNRAVFNVSAKEWINDFNKTNKKLKKDKKPLFTPTTIMETADEVAYAIVIHKAYFDRHDRVVFTVSTKEIQLANNCSNDLINIPCDKFENMRFDIDAAAECTGNWCYVMV